MTDAKPPALFDWATELSDAQGRVTLSEQEAHEIGARLRRLHVENEALRAERERNLNSIRVCNEIINKQNAELESLRTGYAAARLEIESLQARIKTMAEEHADELMVAHLDGRSQAAQQPAPSAAAASKAVLAAIRAANMQLVRTGDDEFMLVTLKQATPQADSQPAPTVGTIAHVGAGKTTLTGAITSALRAARAPADSVLEDAERLEFEMQHGSAIDAARKQGGA